MRNLFSIVCITTALSFSAFSDTEYTQTEKPHAVTKTSEHKAKPEVSSINLDHQKIIDDFRKYLLTVKPTIKDEIKHYRVKIRDLNAKKIELYKKLTEEAQNVLKQEREFKKKLPWPERKELIKEINQQNNTTDSKASAKTETIDMTKPSQNAPLAK